MSQPKQQRHFLLMTSIGGRLVYPTLPECVVTGHLIARGHRVSFLAPSAGPLTRTLEALGAEVELLPLLSKPRTLAGRLQSPLLRRHLSRRYAGVNLIVAMRMSATFTAVPLANKLGIPSVSYIHGHTTKADKFSRYRVDRADAVVAVSEASLESYSAPEGQPCEVIYNGIDGQDFIRRSRLQDLRETLNIPRDYAVVGMAGAYRAKGLDLLVTAAPQVIAQYPHTQFVVAGEFRSAQEEESLRRQLREQGVEDAFHFTGQLAEIAPLMAAADIWTHPTRVDAFPMACLEAMALGQPVVASAVGGIPEMIQHDRTGLLVPPGDAEALAAALCQLLQDPSRAAALGKAAQERVLQAFDLHRQMLKLEDLLLELLGQPPRRY